MMLNLSDLISPFPFNYYKELDENNVCNFNIKSPKLKEIWKLGYDRYSQYLSFLMLTVNDYCTEVNKEYADDFNSLSSEEQTELKLYDFVISDITFAYIFVQIFKFFILENVVWNAESSTFQILNDKNELVGLINELNFEEVRNVILQLCDVRVKEKEEIPKFKNEKARYIWEKTQKAKKLEESKTKKDFELSNIVSKYSANNHSSINILNVWDLTVCQLYNQFESEQNNQSFDINKTSIACWGDSEGKFDITQWFKNFNK